jgi:hypothetical protein
MCSTVHVSRPTHPPFTQLHVLYLRVLVPPEGRAPRRLPGQVAGDGTSPCVSSRRLSVGRTGLGVRLPVIRRTTGRLFTARGCLLTLDEVFSLVPNGFADLDAEAALARPARSELLQDLQVAHDVVVQHLAATPEAVVVQALAVVRVVAGVVSHVTEGAGFSHAETRGWSFDHTDLVLFGRQGDVQRVFEISSRRLVRVIQPLSVRSIGHSGSFQQVAMLVGRHRTHRLRFFVTVAVLQHVVVGGIEPWRSQVEFSW